jgi:hypothetical protein
MQMRSKFTVEYLKNRGVQNSSDNEIEFVGSHLVRISCQMNFARLNRSLVKPILENININFHFQSSNS